MQTFLVFLVLDCIGNLPAAIRQQIGRSIGFLVSLFPSREKKVAIAQLKMLNITEDPALTTREVFQNLSQSVMESLNLSPLLDSSTVSISAHDLELIRSLASSGQGVLALTGHCGNWDLLGSYICSLGYPVHTVGKALRSPLFQHLLQVMRDRSGLKTIWRHDSIGIKSIISVLKQGGILAGLIDQDTLVTSTFLPFFGIPAKTPSSLVDLALRYRCKICIAFMIRVDVTRYAVNFVEVPEGLSRDEVLSLYHQTLEEQIRKYPSQWVWFHKRWRTSKTNVTLGTKDYLDAIESGKIAPAK